MSFREPTGIKQRKARYEEDLLAIQAQKVQEIRARKPWKEAEQVIYEIFTCLATPIPQLVTHQDIDPVICKYVEIQIEQFKSEAPGSLPEEELVQLLATLQLLRETSFVELLAHQLAVEKVLKALRGQ